MDATRFWNEAVRTDDWGGRPPHEFLREVSVAGLRYGGRLLCTMRRPRFVRESQVRAYARLVGAVHQAVRAARGWLEQDGLDGRPDSLAARIGVDPRAVALASIEPGYASAALLARIDTFWLDDGPRILEINAEAPTGMAYGDALADLFLRDPVAARMQGFTAIRSADAAVRAVIGAWREWGGTAPHPRVAIVDLPGVATSSEFELFRAHFHRTGAACEVATPAELSFDGDRLRVGGEPVDVIYRRMLVQDLLDDPARAAPLLEAARARRVCVVNSFRTSLLHGKGLLALLCDPVWRARLDPSVRAVLAAAMPFTGILSDEPGPGAPPDLREQVRRAPSDWVLKPIWGSGGEGVVLGWRTERARWERIVDEAQGMVAQRRLPVPREPFPDASDGYNLRWMQCSLDPYLVAGRLAGFLCRLAEGDLGTVATGASQVPVFIV